VVREIRVSGIILFVIRGIAMTVRVLMRVVRMVGIVGMVVVGAVRLVLGRREIGVATMLIGVVSRWVVVVVDAIAIVIVIVVCHAGRGAFHLPPR
jgi:hypothetical protein